MQISILPARICHDYHAIFKHCQGFVTIAAKQFCIATQTLTLAVTQTGYGLDIRIAMVTTLGDYIHSNGHFWHTLKL